MKIMTQAIFIVMIICNCMGNKNRSSQVISSADLIGTWVHSHEEDTDEYKAYRSGGFDFPPSRGREKIVLKEDGELEYRPIAPNDRPKAYDGKWKIDQSDLVMTYNDKTITFTIVGTSQGLLKLK